MKGMKKQAGDVNVKNVRKDFGYGWSGLLQKQSLAKAISCCSRVGYVEQMIDLLCLMLCEEIQIGENTPSVLADCIQFNEPYE